MVKQALELALEGFLLWLGTKNAVTPAVNSKVTVFLEDGCNAATHPGYLVCVIGACFGAVSSSGKVSVKVVP